MRRIATGFLILLVSACSPTVETTGTSGTAPTLPQTTVTAPPPPDSACPDTENFRDSGRIALFEPQTADATELGTITWSTKGSCETFTFEFFTDDGTPATTAPPLAVDYLTDREVLRIAAGVTTTVVSDQLVETALVERAFVVRSEDGGALVDLHLRGATIASVDVQSSPARATIRIQPGGPEPSGTTALADNLVLTKPDDGDESGTLVMVEGYVLDTDRPVVVIATAGGEIANQMTIEVPDGEGMWSRFAVTLPLPAGEVALFVGEEDPGDGHLVGVTVDVTIR